ncbi:hypothetical protein MKO06_01065 [Gramella sp. GC03-9]|uniref:Glycoamylase-like domain-containing protein n=1 Tax=Christiangramia oceanisediminis TaxID=2920386 RepID=A0A9X2KVI5_9FLAO|nr:glucoamylase family protein [Gramella oceanisediminis]MCP9198478.1 hypothetical protein [Gramella oceanisediminis]
MKLKILFILILPFSILAQEPEYHKVFFENSLMEKSWYHSEVDYNSPSFVLNIEKRLPVNNTEAFTPGNSLSLVYDSAAEGDWTVDLKFPEWRGKDHFKKADQLGFWILVKSETKPTDLPEIGIKRNNSISKNLKLSGHIQEIKRGEWMQVRIPLANFGVDVSGVDRISGIEFSQSSGSSGNHEILIDQVELSDSGAMNTSPEKVEIRSAEGFERHVDLVWENLDPEKVRYVKIYRSQDGSGYKAIGVQNTQHFSKYTDFTGEADQQYSYKISAVGHDYSESELSAPVTAATRSMSDEELLTMVQEASFNYYWDGAEKQSGLALENIPGRKNMVASGASGFGLMALITGAERNFISRDQFVERMEKIVTFLEKAERFHGAYSHFIDGPTGQVEPFFGNKDNGADLVETSFLMQGLLTVRQYLSEEKPSENKLRERITKIWEGVEWDWFVQENSSDYLTWHWSPDQQWVIDHQLIGWNETMITYFLAIASPGHSVGAQMYYSGWASQEKKAQDYRSNWGEGPAGSMYTNENTYFGIPLKVGVGVGGPLFFTHYSYLGLDPHKMEDTYVNYFENNKDIVLINYRYSLENPGGYEGYGKNSWGLTASDGPEGYKAREAKPSQDDGTIAPTGAIASYPYTPEKSLEALKHFYRNYGSFLWGEYGFRDAFNLTEDWTTPIYMGLNQAPMTVMIENHRTGLLWELFMQNEEVQQALNEIKNQK